MDEAHSFSPTPIACVLTQILPPVILRVTSFNTHSGFVAVNNPSMIHAKSGAPQQLMQGQSLYESAATVPLVVTAT